MRVIAIATKRVRAAQARISRSVSLGGLAHEGPGVGFRRQALFVLSFGLWEISPYGARKRVMEKGACHGTKGARDRGYSIRRSFCRPVRHALSSVALEEGTRTQERPCHGGRGVLSRRCPPSCAFACGEEGQPAMSACSDVTKLDMLRQHMKSVMTMMTTPAMLANAWFFHLPRSFPLAQ